MPDVSFDSGRGSSHSGMLTRILDWKLQRFFETRNASFRICRWMSLGIDKARSRACVHCAPRILHLARQNSAWNNTEIFTRMIRTLSKALVPFRAVKQPVLLMDSLPLHISEPALRELVKADIWPIIIPPQTTDMLQVPDTHIFAPLKAELREECDRTRAHLRGDMSMRAYIGCIRSALDNVLYNRSWLHAFNQNGYALNQVGASKKLNDALNEAVSACKPTAHELSLCCPRNRAAAARSLHKKFIERDRRVIVPPPRRHGRKRHALDARLAEYNVQALTGSLCLSLRGALVCSSAAPALKQPRGVRRDLELPFQSDDLKNIAPSSDISSRICFQ